MKSINDFYDDRLKDKERKRNKYIVITVPDLFSFVYSY